MIIQNLILRTLNQFFFYFSNRWDVQTIDGILIKLPKKNLVEALSIAHKIIKDDQFRYNQVIDLRISNHVIITNEK